MSKTSTKNLKFKAKPKKVSNILAEFNLHVSDINKDKWNNTEQNKYNIHDNLNEKIKVDDEEVEDEENIEKIKVNDRRKIFIKNEGVIISEKTFDNINSKSWPNLRIVCDFDSGSSEILQKDPNKSRTSLKENVEARIITIVSSICKYINYLSGIDKNGRGDGSGDDDGDAGDPGAGPGGDLGAGSGAGPGAGAGGGPGAGGDLGAGSGAGPGNDDGDGRGDGRGDGGS